MEISLCKALVSPRRLDICSLLYERNLSYEYKLETRRSSNPYTLPRESTIPYLKSTIAR